MPPMIAAASRLLTLALALAAASPALASHGAVANGPEGRFGWSHDYETQIDADRRALEECGRRCRILFQFHDTCAAYAEGHSGGFGWERSNSEATARERALEHCRRETRDCRLRVSTCAF